MPPKCPCTEIPSRNAKISTLDPHNFFLAMFCGTKFKETLFLRKMNLVLKGWALLLPLQFWPKCLLPPPLTIVNGAPSVFLQPHTGNLTPGPRLSLGWHPCLQYRTPTGRLERSTVSEVTRWVREQPPPEPTVLPPVPATDASPRLASYTTDSHRARSSSSDPARRASRSPSPHPGWSPPQPSPRSLVSLGPRMQHHGHSPA
jgi:hypothetical protein